MRCGRQPSDTCRASTPRRTACVSPRSHCFGTRQPHQHVDHALGSRQVRKRLSAPLGTRGRAFACQSRMQPHSARLRDTKTPLSHRRVPASATCKSVFMPSHSHAGIDLQPLSSSTTDSRGPSLARSFAEQKASQSLPALQAPVPSRGGRHLRGDRPEVPLRSACAFDLCQPCGWALLEARQGHRSPDPALDAGPRSRHHPSTRASRRQRLCLPSWAPRWSPLKRSTPLWTFGQGWTHARRWRCELQD